jgi:predicted dehydrogenase
VLRVGLVGYGYWGPNYARLLRESERAVLTWCCDLSSAALTAAKQPDPAIKTTPHLDELLEAPDCDAVIVIVPTSRHYLVAKRVIEAGKHLLVGKPLADERTSAQFAQAAEARWDDADGRSLIASTGTPRR